MTYGRFDISVLPVYMLVASIIMDRSQQSLDRAIRFLTMMETPKVVTEALQTVGQKERSVIISYIAELQLNQPDAISTRRRKSLLASIEFLPERFETCYREMLTDDEKDDALIVYKILEHAPVVYCGINGSCPFSENRFEFPFWAKDDPDAFISFIRNEHIYVGVIPEQFQDNLRVMKEACLREANFLKHASPRLKDDEYLVRVALLEKDEYCMRARHIEHASERLKKDFQLIYDLVEYAARSKMIDKYGWLEYVLLDQLDEEELLLVLKKIPTSHLRRLTFRFGVYEKFLDNKEAILYLIENGPIDRTSPFPYFQFCSDRLRADEEVIRLAISKNRNSVKYSLCDSFPATDVVKDIDDVLTEYICDYIKDRVSRVSYSAEDLSIVLQSIANNEGLDSFERIPEAMKSNPAVIEVSINTGIINFCSLQKYSRLDKNTILSFIKGVKDRGGEYDLPLSFYSKLPDKLQEDEEIALAILDVGFGFEYPERIFKKLPQLSRSRKALLSMFEIELCRNSDDYVFDLVAECPFRDDKEFMLAACKCRDDIAELASGRLLSDRDFMVALADLGCVSFICYATSEFQLDNLDLIQRAIENLENSSVDEVVFFDSLSPDVWLNKDMVVKWATCRPSIGYLLESVHPESPFLDDKDVISLAVEKKECDLEHASSRLKSDREFILKLVKEHERILHYASTDLRFDEEILIAASAKCAGNVLDCFDSMFDWSGLIDNNETKFLTKIAAKVRSKMELHCTYVKDFLGGISSVAMKSRMKPNLPCYLPMLDQGAETSIALKKLIAEFLGVPVCGEFHQYKAALMAFAKFGF